MGVEYVILGCIWSWVVMMSVVFGEMCVEKVVFLMVLWLDFCVVWVRFDVIKVLVV